MPLLYLYRLKDAVIWVLEDPFPRSFGVLTFIVNCYFMFRFGLGPWTRSLENTVGPYVFTAILMAGLLVPPLIVTKLATFGVRYVEFQLVRRFSSGNTIESLYQLVRSTPHLRGKLAFDTALDQIGKRAGELVAVGGNNIPKDVVSRLNRFVEAGQITTPLMAVLPAVGNRQSLDALKQFKRSVISELDLGHYASDHDLVKRIELCSSTLEERLLGDRESKRLLRPAQGRDGHADDLL